MGRLVANVAKYRNRPKTKAWVDSHDAAGEANPSSAPVISTRTGEKITALEANVYDQDPETAVHEGMHMMATPGKTKYKHDFIAAADIFDARTQVTALNTLRNAKRHGTEVKDIKPHLNAMAAQEYELGARLMYDPSRGHFARQTVQASLESLADPKGTYVKYRNKQSYFGRGMKEPWELLRK